MKHIDSISIEHVEQLGNVINIWEYTVAHCSSKFSVYLLCWLKYTRPCKLGIPVDTCRIFAKSEKRRCWSLTDMVQEIKKWSTFAG